MSRLFTLLFIFAVTSAAFAGFASNEVYLASIGRGGGANGAQFYSTLWVTNLSTSQTVHFTFFFLKDGQSNLTGDPSFNDTLAPGQTKLYENVTETKLNLPGLFGAARITADGEIFASERVYNLADPSDDLGTSEGLFFAAVPKSFAIGQGETASIQGVNQGNPAENMRTNFDLVETTGNSCKVHVSLLDSNGTSQGTTDVNMNPFGHVKLNAQALLHSINMINGRIVATVTSGSGNVILAGEQLGNTSQDSSGFEMSFKDSLLGGNCGICVMSLNGLTGALTLTPGSGISITPSGSSIAIAYTGGGSNGLTSVAHNGTLAGSGTGASPLGIALPLTLSGTTSTGTTLASVLGSGAGTGILGTSSSGAGIIGSADSDGLGVAGVALGIAPAEVVPPGTGVFGRGANYGVFAEALPGGTAVSGRTSGGNAAVEGLNFGAGPGAFGSSVNGVGVSGSASGASSNATGVKGESDVTNATGVHGIANNGASGYGIWGESTHGFAGKFNGNVNVVGTLSVSGSITAGVKDFKIDDPLDPENKYLVHASVESSEMMNIYSGNVALGPDGGAVVKLPAWIEKANEDFRYQLTCIGGFAGVYVAHEVSEGRFSIAGGLPGMKISWQLTGVRSDAFAKAHPLVVEEAKSPAERGHYLHPDAFGQPEEKGIDRAHDLEKKRHD